MQAGAFSVRPDLDRYLLQRVLQKDVDAFSLLYDTYCRTLYTLAVRIVRDHTEAETVVHDVFLYLWEHTNTYDEGRGSLAVWLVTLTRNRAIDRRRAGASKRDTLEGADPLPESLQAVNTPEPLDSLLEQEQRVIVRNALETLPVAQRNALELAYFDGLTQTQIAAQIGEPLGTVKTRIRLGLRKLREVLSPYLQAG